MAKAKFNGPEHQELRKFLAKTENAFCLWQHKVSSQTLFEAWVMNGRLVIFAFYEPDGWVVWLPSTESETENAFAEIRAAIGLDPI